MANRFVDRLEHAWSAFTNRESLEERYNLSPISIGSQFSGRPDRPRTSMVSEKSTLVSTYVRIAMDVAAAEIRHVILDSNDRYLREIKSGLNDCLSMEANLDQTGTAFLMDVVMSLFDEGVVAIVPVETSIDPKVSGSYDIRQLRTGKILEWYPESVKVQVYNQKKGIKQEVILPKRQVAIVENPLYSVMNEPNSTLKRLIRKMALLDKAAETLGAGKLDLIIQLPYVIKTEARQKMAESRRKDIEMQLASSKYGIAYTDGTEKVQQLNRPVENTLLNEVKFLTEQLHSELGVTAEIKSGTADERVMKNYYSRTVDPILKAIIDAMRVKFLTKTARTQGHSIMYYRDPFQLVPVSDLAAMADTFTRNAILSSNEIRAIIGYKPSEDPAANELSNKNMPVDQQPGAPVDEESYDMSNFNT